MDGCKVRKVVGWREGGGREGLVGTVWLGWDGMAGNDSRIYISGSARQNSITVAF